MEYPYSWTTTHGHRVIVNELENGQYYFTGTYNNERETAINFNVSTGPYPSSMCAEKSFTVEEHEVYIEWSAIVQQS